MNECKLVGDKVSGCAGRKSGKARVTRGRSWQRGVRREWQRRGGGKKGAAKEERGREMCVGRGGVVKKKCE